MSARDAHEVNDRNSGSQLPLRFSYRAKRVAVLAVAVILLVADGRALERGLPSKTAVMVAAFRAIGSKNPDPSQRNPDDLAIKFLGPHERAVLAGFPAIEALDLDFDTAMTRGAGIAASVAFHTDRTKFFDAALIAAVSQGAAQVVVLGAGFDSRGYRFQDRLSGARFFEVDSGPTQEYKKRRVHEILDSMPTVRYVSMDFTKDDLLTQLAKSGYVEKARTVFIWEGVVYYLPESSVRSTLRFVRDHSAPGSTIAFDYPLASAPDVNNPRSQYARWGEPWLFGFPGRSASEYVKRQGLDVVSDDFTTISSLRVCIARVPERRR